MDKLRNSIMQTPLVDFFQGKMSGEENTNLSWRLLLGGALLGAFGIVAFTLHIYQWATAVPHQTVITKSRVAFSINELRDVIALYQKKSEEFKALGQSRPESPRLERGSEVVITASTTESTL